MQEENNAMAGGEEEAGGEDMKKRKGQYGGLPKSHPAMIKAGAAVPKHKKSELKRPEQILKSRVVDERRRKSGGGGDRNRQGSRVQHEHLTDEEWKEYTM
jgi:hypothetical protein